jgi:hypothetical protein
MECLIIGAFIAAVILGMACLAVACLAPPKRD